jgi:hypothetical protein
MRFSWVAEAVHEQIPCHFISADLLSTMKRQGLPNRVKKPAKVLDG